MIDYPETSRKPAENSSETWRKPAGNSPETRQKPAGNPSLTDHTEDNFPISELNIIVFSISNFRYHKYISLSSCICLGLTFLPYLILQNKLKISSKLILHYLFAMMMANVATLVTEWKHDSDWNKITPEFCTFWGK